MEGPLVLSYLGWPSFTAGRDARAGIGEEVKDGPW